MNSDDLEKFNELIGEMARQASVSLSEIGLMVNNMITSLAEGLEKAMEMMTVPLSEFLEAYREALSKAPNNWLKMHGYPMRRRYVCKHTNQRGGRK